MIQGYQSKRFFVILSYFGPANKNLCCVSVPSVLKYNHRETDGCNQEENIIYLRASVNKEECSYNRCTLVLMRRDELVPPTYCLLQK